MKRVLIVVAFASCSSPPSGVDADMPDGDVAASDTSASDSESDEADEADEADDADDAVADDAATPTVHAFEAFQDRAWTWDQTSDTCAYTNNGIPWDWLLHGREPVDAGRYPVFLYFHGTGDVGDGVVNISVIESMAARGFVAVSVTYDSLSGLGQTLDDPQMACPILDKKVECLFGSGSESVITKVCGRARANCDAGIVVAGHSQGSAIAIRAKDVEGRVEAAWGLAAGLHLDVEVLGITARTDATPCLPPGVRALPADRLRVVNGESEYAYGDDLFPDLRDVTGADCPDGTLDCLNADGSGWALFPDAANEDGRGLSQHCYMANMPAGDCTAATGLNSAWTAGDAPHSREPALDWLAGFVAR